MTNIVQNEWQYGLCECYRNPGTCCKVFCCSPCVVCNNGEAVEKDGCLWCLISCCLPDIASALFRSSAREKYGIEGDECEDWVSHLSVSSVSSLSGLSPQVLGCFCTPCVVCQTAAEHEERGQAGMANN